MTDTSDEWDFEAISLPPGCWVHSTSGDIVLPGGTVIGKLNEGGIDAMTDDGLIDLLERSKNDHEIIVGSEVRQLIGMIRELRNERDVLREALKYAHDLMFEYGFSSNDLRPVRAALEAKP